MFPFHKKDLEKHSLGFGLSQRKILRVKGPKDNETWIEMIHESSEAKDHWKQVHLWLQGRGLSTPPILGEEGSTLFVKDLGDLSLNRLWKKDALKGSFFQRNALDALSLLQSSPVPPWKIVKWTWTKALKEWERTQKIWEQRDPNAQMAALFSFCEEKGRPLWDRSDWVLCHRDYHGENLLVFEGDLFWIDAQDLFLGPRGYDEMSLIYDPYRSYPAYYLPNESEQLIAIQRLLKSCGNYLENWEEGFYFQALKRACTKLTQLFEKFLPEALLRQFQKDQKSLLG